MHFRSVLWRGEKVAVSLEQVISLWAHMGEGERRERYIHVPIHEYTKLLLINHSYTQSIRLAEYPVFVKYEVGFAVSTGFPESLEGT